MRVVEDLQLELARLRIARERAFLRLHAVNQANRYTLDPDTRQMRRAIASYHHVTLAMIAVAFRFARWHQASHRAARRAAA